jgi:hypothetical protein
MITLARTTIVIALLLALMLIGTIIGARAQEELEGWKGIKLEAWECPFHGVGWRKWATDIHQLVITWSPKEVGAIAESW